MLTLTDRPAGGWMLLARLARWAAWGLAALLAAALLIATAWVLSNWSDIEPVPRPPELALPTPKVSDERNAFFTLLGLSAPLGQDPAAAGRAEWAAQLASAQARAQSAVAGAAASARAPAWTTASATMAGAHDKRAAAERLTLQSFNALALRDARLAALLAPQMLVLPDQAEAVRRWIAVESAYQRGVLDEMEAACPRPASAPVGEVQGASGWRASSLSNWLMCHGIGWHPQRTRAAMDAAWQRSQGALRAGLPAAIRQREHEVRQQSEQPALGSQITPLPLSWRNTFGALTLHVAQPFTESYLARHADLQLHHEAAVLAVAAQATQLPAAGRAAWLAGQRLSDEARARLAFSADGLTLAARTWAEDRAAPDKVAERDAIRIRWPGAPAAQTTPK